MTSGLYNWSKTASSNSTADGTINWAEGQAPSTVNDSARAMMARTAEYRDDQAGSLTTGGTATAFTLTTNQVFTSLTLLNGQSLRVKFNATNGAAPTLAVDGLTAEPLQLYSGTAVPTGMILSGTIWDVTYVNSIPAFIVKGVPGVMPATAFTGALSGADGTVSLPEYAFTNDLDCGMYRIGTNNIGVAVNGAKVLDVGTAGLGVTGTLTSSGVATVNDATDASSTSTGSTIIAGGVGIAKKLYVGTGLSVGSGTVSLPAGSIANAALAAPGGMVKISTQTASTSASLAFTGIDSTYKSYRLVFENIVTVTNATTLLVQVSQDGGSSYLTTGYLALGLFFVDSGSTGVVSGTIGLLLTQASIAANSGIGASGEVILFDPSNSTTKKSMTYMGMYFRSDGHLEGLTSNGYYNGNTTAVNAIRIIAASGSLTSGSATLYGMTG